MLKKIYQYIIIFGFFFSCNEPTRNIHREPSPNFITDIPVHNKEDGLKGQIDFMYKYINKDASVLKLDSLELGYDSLQIRIWLGHSMAVKRYVVVLKYKEGIWLGNLVTFKKGGDNIIYQNTVRDKNIKKVIPKSGWDKFFENMSSLKLLTLEDEKNLAGYNGCAGDGNPFYFEWATEKKYRFYSYCNPEHNPTFWQANNVIEIANMLEKEFDFEYIK